MTAKYIDLPDYVLSEREIRDVVAVAQDVFCPEMMTLELVELAVRAGMSVVRDQRTLDASED